MDGRSHRRRERGSARLAKDKTRDTRKKLRRRRGVVVDVVSCVGGGGLLNCWAGAKKVGAKEGVGNGVRWSGGVVGVGGAYMRNERNGGEVQHVCANEMK